MTAPLTAPEFLITRHGQEGTLVPTFADGAWLRCPACGNDDLGQWANDGEADLADWWDCRCGAHGALVQVARPDRTLNGLPATSTADAR